MIQAYRLSRMKRQVVKGSEAVGSAIRVGFSAPQHCSTSQVRRRTSRGHTVSFIASITTYLPGLFAGYAREARCCLRVPGVDVVFQSSCSGGFSSMCRLRQTLSSNLWKKRRCCPSEDNPTLLLRKALTPCVSKDVLGMRRLFYLLPSWEFLV